MVLDTLVESRTFVKDSESEALLCKFYVLHSYTMNSLKTSPNNLRNIAPLQPVLLALILLLGGCECHIK